MNCVTVRSNYSLMHAEKLVRIAVRCSNVIGFSIRKCPSFTSGLRDIFIWKTCARYCLHMHACTCTCIHHDFRDDFSTDLSTVMAQMHVTPYVPFAASRLALPYRCRLFLLRVAADRQGGIVTCAISFFEFF